MKHEVLRPQACETEQGKGGVRGVTTDTPPWSPNCLEAEIILRHKLQKQRRDTDRVSVQLRIPSFQMARKACTLPQDTWEVGLSEAEVSPP